MWKTLVQTAPTVEPVLAAELREHLRLNDSSEDAQLTMYLKASRELFEKLTGRAVYTQTIRQYFQTLPCRIVLMRGPVQSLTAVKYYNPAGTLTTSTDHTSDIISDPGLVQFPNGVPSTSTTVSPVGYVDYVCGWTSQTIPEQVRLAIKLLAGHYYENREAVGDTVGELAAVTLGFKAICDQYKSGTFGDWGQ